MPVAQRRRPHVAQTDGSFAAAVDEGVALERMELRCCDHLRQLLHVGRFDVNDVLKVRVREQTCCVVNPGPRRGS